MLGGLRDRLSPAANVLAFPLAVIAVALVGGLIPAIIEAVAGTLLLHALLTLQPGEAAIAGVSDAAVLGVLIALAVVVGLLAEEVARRGRQAAFAARAVRLGLPDTRPSRYRLAGRARVAPVPAQDGRWPG